MYLPKPSFIVEADPEEVLSWVKKNCMPDDIFDDDVLESWALQNGFIKDNSG